MNFREVLSATTEIGPLAGDGSLHPYALEPREDADAAISHGEAFQRYCELSPAYQQLAWSYLGGLAEATRAMADGPLKERHLELLEASQSGMAPMARYLSILPDVYVSHRAAFPGMPADLDVQVAELGAIAARSSGFLSTIARETMAVSGRIEEAQGLRGALPGNPSARVEDSAWDFVLETSDEGLYVRPRFNLQGQVTAVRERFALAVEQGKADPQRAVGCLLLRAAHEAHGTVFEAIWQQLVVRAVAEPRLFRQSLEEIQALQLAEQF